MNTNRHECFSQSAAKVNDLAAARGMVVCAATGAKHTVALRFRDSCSLVSVRGLNFVTVN